MAKTRWFNAIKEPPVRRGKYEIRGAGIVSSDLVWYNEERWRVYLGGAKFGEFPGDEWRGITRDEYLRRGGK